MASPSYNEDDPTPILFDWRANQTTVEKVLMMMREIKLPNARIFINEDSFDCNTLILQLNSRYFCEAKADEICASSGLKMFTLPHKQVSMWAFKQLYKWMVHEDIPIELSGFAERLQAAKYLGVDEYLEQCWACLQKHSVLENSNYFLIYQEAREHNMEDIVQVCLKSITLFFLPLVASVDFLRMPIEDVDFLLNSDAIFIHSELDAFMSAVRWLNHDWDARQHFSGRLMKTVRFALVSGKQLFAICFNGSDKEIENVLKMPKVMDLIRNAQFYLALKIEWVASNEDEFKRYCQQLPLEIPKPRAYKQNRDVKHVRSYQHFHRFLQKLKKQAPYSYATIDTDPESDEEDYAGNGIVTKFMMPCVTIDYSKEDSMQSFSSTFRSSLSSGLQRPTFASISSGSASDTLGALSLSTIASTSETSEASNLSSGNLSGS